MEHKLRSNCSAASREKERFNGMLPAPNTTSNSNQMYNLFFDDTQNIRSKLTYIIYRRYQENLKIKEKKTCKKNFTSFSPFLFFSSHRLPPQLDNISNACKLSLIGLMRMYSVWMASANYALARCINDINITRAVTHVAYPPATPRLIVLSRGPD